MRKIKFRAWNKKEKKWFPAEKFALNSYAFIIEILDKKIRQPIELSQYTGLKDKFGKEIFEGDIVETYHEKYPREYPGKMYPNGTGKRVVKWIMSEHHNGWNIYSGKKSQYEIIGNIYQNKELI